MQKFLLSSLLGNDLNKEVVSVLLWQDLLASSLILVSWTLSVEQDRQSRLNLSGVKQLPGLNS